MCMLHFMTLNYQKNSYKHFYQNSEDLINVRYQSMLSSETNINIVNHNKTILSSFTQYRLLEKNSMKIEEEKAKNEDTIMENTEEAKQVFLKDKLNLEELSPLVYEDLLSMKIKLTENNTKLEIYQDQVSSTPIDFYCLSASFTNNFTREFHNFHAKRIVFGGDRIYPSKSTTPGRLLQDKSTLLP